MTGGGERAEWEGVSAPEVAGEDGAGRAGGPGEGLEIFVSVAERVRRSLDGASAGERLVARTLLANYPTAGLETATRLAERAGVSAPTVVRFVARLGFAGYRAFQQDLRDEIEARRASPLTLAQQVGAGGAPQSLRVSAGATFRQRLDESFAALSDPELEAVVDLLADPARRIALIGGRFSHILAEYLDLHLRLLRPGTRVLDPRPESLAAFSVDVGRRDVVVVFDYRRYQRDVVEFARRAHGRGAKVVLFTDPWLSPAAEAADLVIPVRVEAPSPFDSLVPALALVETVVAGVMARLGKEGEERLRQCEEIVGDVTVGKAVPLVFVLGLVGVALVAYGFVRLTRHFNHAGSVYALAGVTLGPRAGFFGGFALLGTYLFFAVCTLAATAVFTEAFAAAMGLSAHIPWSVVTVVAAVGAWAVNSRESRITARTLLIVEGVGIIGMLVLSAIIVIRTGAGNAPGGQTLDFSVFGLGDTTMSAVMTATVFAFLSWAGFEACASLGEETADPRRNVPRALAGSVLLTGGLYVLVMFAQTVGFGTDGKGVDRRTGSPTAALVAALVLAVAGDMILDLTGVPAFDAYYWFATLGVLCLLVAYAVAGAGVIAFILSGRGRIPRYEIVIPVLAIAYLCFVFYEQSVGQDSPLSYFPWVAAAWCLAGMAAVLAAPKLARRIGERLTAELTEPGDPATDPHENAVRV